MSLPSPPPKYDLQDQSRTRGEIERLDGQNHKKTNDIEVGSKKRVIFTDTVTGHRYALTIASGALTVTGPL